jgi:hypothetical protein
MAQAKNAGEASAREGSLSPGERKLARGFKALEFDLRFHEGNEKEVFAFLDDLDVALLRHFAVQGDDEDCEPEESAGSLGLEVERSFAKCLGLQANGTHVHVAYTCGFGRRGPYRVRGVVYRQLLQDPEQKPQRFLVVMLWQNGDVELKVDEGEEDLLYEEYEHNQNNVILVPLTDENLQILKQALRGELQ